MKGLHYTEKKKKGKTKKIHKPVDAIYCSADLYLPHPSHLTLS